MQIKKFEDYGLDVKYLETIKKYFNDTIQILGDDMLMFVLTSSCGLERYISGWSDIDVLIVVKELDFVKLQQLHKAQEQYSIKIALALLSAHEIDLQMFDDKTNVVFYQLYEGMLAPNFVAQNYSLTLPRVTLSDIQKDDLRMMPMYLHKLRRLLYAPSDDKRSIIKAMYIVLKMCLRSPEHEIIAISYAEAFARFADEFDEQHYDIMTEMLSGQKASNGFIEYCRRVVEKICNGKI